MNYLKYFESFDDLNKKYGINMKYLKYFEAASSNNFLKEVATRAAAIYQNILPQFDGDYIKDWKRQDRTVQNIYNLINKAALEVYPQFGTKKKFSYDEVMQVLKPKLDEIIEAKMFDLYTQMMTSIYKDRYAHILPDEDIASSKLGVNRDKYRPKEIANIYGRLEQVIKNGWDNVISNKLPENITSQDIADITANMDSIINEFEKTPEGISMMKQIDYDKKREADRSTPIKYIDPMIIRQGSIDYGSFETSGPWNKTNLFNPLKKLPKYQQTPPKID